MRRLATVNTISHCLINVYNAISLRIAMYTYTHAIRILVSTVVYEPGHIRFIEINITI